MTSSPMVLMEFENLPEDDNFVHHHQHHWEGTDDNDDDMSLSSSSSCLSASSSLLAANDNNMSQAEFHNLPIETRNILKTIQTINDEDDISFNSEAAEEIVNHITHTLHSNLHYNNHNGATAGINKCYRYNPPSHPSLSPTNNDSNN